MQNICKEYARNMQSMQKEYAKNSKKMKKICKNMQKMCKTKYSQRTKTVSTNIRENRQEIGKK